MAIGNLRSTSRLLSTGRFLSSRPPLDMAQALRNHPHRLPRAGPRRMIQRWSHPLPVELAATLPGEHEVALPRRARWPRFLNRGVVAQMCLIISLARLLTAPRTSGTLCRCLSIKLSSSPVASAPLICGSSIPRDVHMLKPNRGWEERKADSRNGSGLMV